MREKSRLICCTMLCIAICVAVACNKDNGGGEDKDTVIDSPILVGYCPDAPKERFAICDSSAHIDFDNYNSVSVVYDDNHFHCNPFSHSIWPDTIKVCGYLLAYNGSYDFFIGKVPESGEIYLRIIDIPDSNGFDKSGRYKDYVQMCHVDMEFRLAQELLPTLSPNDKIYFTCRHYSMNCSEGRSAYSDEYVPVLYQLSIDSIERGQ